MTWIAAAVIAQETPSAATKEDYVHEGIANIRKNQIDAALACFNKAIALDTNYALAYYNRAMLLDDYKKDYAAAVADYSVAIAANVDVKAWRYRGYARYQLDDYDGSIDDLKKALDLDLSSDRAALKHDLGSAYVMRAELREKKNQFNEALADLNAGIDLQLAHPEGSSFVNRGRVKAALGDIPGAWQDLDQSLKTDPTLKTNAIFLKGQYFIHTRASRQLEKSDAAHDDKQSLALINGILAHSLSSESEKFYLGRKAELEKLLGAVAPPRQPSAAPATVAEATPEKPPASAGSPTKWRDEIDRLIQQDKFDDALAKVDALLKDSPNDKDLLDLKAQLQKSAKPVTAPAAPKLSGEDRLTLATLNSISDDIKAATDAESRKKLMREFLDQSKEFIEKHPDQMNVWLMRAAAAAELEDVEAGWQAGQKLKALGALDSDDAQTLKGMAALKRKGWLTDDLEAVKSGAKDAKIKELADKLSPDVKKMIGTWKLRTVLPCDGCGTFKNIIPSGSIQVFMADDGSARIKGDAAAALVWETVYDYPEDLRLLIREQDLNKPFNITVDYTENVRDSYSSGSFQKGYKNDYHWEDSSVKADSNNELVCYLRATRFVFDREN